MGSQAVLGTRPPSLLPRMKGTSEHQDEDKNKTKQNKPDCPQTPAPGSPRVRRPAGVHFVTWSGAGQSWRDGTGHGAGLGPHPWELPPKPQNLHRNFPLCPRATASGLAERGREPWRRLRGACSTARGDFGPARHQARVLKVQPGFPGPPVLPGGGCRSIQKPSLKVRSPPSFPTGLPSPTRGRIQWTQKFSVPESRGHGMESYLESYRSTDVLP